MSGANSGGAENFFERLAIAFEKESLVQKVIIRYHKERFDYLNTKLSNLKYIKFFNNFNPFCQSTIEKSIKAIEDENSALLDVKVVSLLEKLDIPLDSVDKQLGFLKTYRDRIK